MHLTRGILVVSLLAKAKERAKRIIFFRLSLNVAPPLLPYLKSLIFFSQLALATAALAPEWEEGEWEPPPPLELQLLSTLTWASAPSAGVG